MMNMKTRDECLKELVKKSDYWHLLKEGKSQVINEAEQILSLDRKRIIKKISGLQKTEENDKQRKPRKRYYDKEFLLYLKRF